MQPNRKQVAELKKNPIVAAWIEAHQKDKWHMPGDSDRHANCRVCGWPHNKHVMCGVGATFGFVRLGRHSFSIDASNVEYMLHFTEQLSEGRGFHWRDETFFGGKGWQSRRHLFGKLQQLAPTENVDYSTERMALHR